MADQLEVKSASELTKTFMVPAYGTAVTRGQLRTFNKLAVFAFDTYAEGQDSVFVYAAPMVRITEVAGAPILDAVNFSQGQRIYWDGVKVSNLMKGLCIGICLEANDLSGGVSVGDSLLIEFNQDSQPQVLGGTVLLDGANPVSVVTGLTTIFGATASILKNSSPGDDPVQVTVTFSGGNLEIFAWKTDGSDPTLIASTNNTETVSWVAIGY
ncbi:MAG: hypothetical protein AB1757_21320 [Acidobacteriota bacterium]